MNFSCLRAPIARGILLSVAAKRALAIPLIAVLGLGAPAAARADTPVATAQSPEELASIAYRLYSDGKYGEAVGAYLKVYDAAGLGDALFNVANIYDRKLKERSLAAEYYRRYLKAPDADPDLVTKANERLAVLKREADDEARAAGAAVAPTVATPSSAPPAAPAAPVPLPPEGDSHSEHSRGTPMRVAGVVTGAVGLLGLVTSGVASVIAKGKNKDADNVCAGHVCPDGNGVSLAHQAGNAANVATVSLVAGLALVGTGVALFVFAPSGKRDSKAASVRISPAVGLGGAGLSMAGQF